MENKKGVSDVFIPNALRGKCAGRTAAFNESDIASERRQCQRQSQSWRSIFHRNHNRWVRVTNRTPDLISPFPRCRSGY